MTWLVIDLDPEHQDLAQTLYQRRSSDLPRARAEAALLQHYHYKLTVDDLDHQLDMKLTDLDGKSVRVVSGFAQPLRVFADDLGADSYVFLQPMSNIQALVLGWLPREQVEQAPVEWFEKNGRRVNYAHFVTIDFFGEPPPEFRFVSQCPHERYGAIWDWGKLGWECCHCGQFRYDEGWRDWDERSRRHEKARQHRAASEATRKRLERS